MLKKTLPSLGLALVLTLVLTATAQADAVAQSFAKVKASTAGDGLFVKFVEVGLDPGQNYAYTGSGSAQETFQCYRSSTFTPTHRKRTLSAGTYPDPRAYQANNNGVVRGFIYLYPDIATPDFCTKHQETVPVHVCFEPYDLVDFVQPFDVYYWPHGTKVCGAIEPD